MQTKADKMDEPFCRYETLAERYTAPDGTRDLDGEMKEWDEIERALSELCLKDTRNIERVLARIDTLLTRMFRNDPDEFGLFCVDYYSRVIIGGLKMETITPYHQRVKDLMRKAFEVMERYPDKRVLFPPHYALLNIVIFLEFQDKE